MKVLYESGENYLEAILVLKKQKSVVHSVDIASYFDFSKASVSRAVKILSQEGYIVIQKSGAIDFTDKGLETANKIYERHLIITKYLNKVLNIPQETAETDACRIEHVISKETFYAIRDAVKDIK